MSTVSALEQQLVATVGLFGSAEALGSAAALIAGTHSSITAQIKALRALDIRGAEQLNAAIHKSGFTADLQSSLGQVVASRLLEAVTGGGVYGE